MRRVLITALAAAAIGLVAAAPAEAAATLQLCTSGASCVSGTTNVNLDSFNAPGASTVSGTVGIGGPAVNFTSTDGLLETNTGAATIFRADGLNLTQLTFTLLTGSFTAAEFNLESGSPKSFDLVLSALGGGSQTIHINNANGSNIFNIIAATGESYTSASFVSSQGGFDDFKQLRLVLAPGAVPEPATWGMMLLGFAGMGAAMRRNRKRNVALMQIA